MSRPAKAMVNTEELGRAIRRRREELGLSLRDVATETAVWRQPCRESKMGPESQMLTTLHVSPPGLMCQWNAS